MSLKVEWLEDWDRPELADEWEALLSAGSHPFDTYDWYRAWWEAFGGADRLAVCTVRRNGNLAGALPLRSRGRRLAGLVNVHSCIFRPLAADEEAATALVDAALGRSASVLALGLLPDEPPWLAMLDVARRAHGRLAYREPGPDSPVVDTTGEWEGWLTGEHASWRKRLARYRRKLDRDYEASFEIVVAPDDYDAWIEQGFALEASGWKGRAGTAIDSSRDTAGFYREVARRFHARGELRLSRIRLGGEVVAFSFCILHGSRLYSLKTGFDESFKKVVPGLVLQLSIIERCFKSGLDAYELLGEGSEWKRKLSDGHRTHTNLWLYSRTPLGRGYRAYRALLRPQLKRAYRVVRSRRL